MTSNVNNQGIAHASYRAGGVPLCNNRRAHMSFDIEKFRALGGQCRRCAAKVAKMDAKQRPSRTTDEILSCYSA